MTQTVGGLRIMDIAFHPACECGNRQPTRRGTLRTPTERRTTSTAPARVPRDETNARVAAALLAHERSIVPWPGIRSKLVKKGATGRELEKALEELTRGGMLELVAVRNKGDWDLRRVHVLDRDALAEHVNPGHRARLADAIRSEGASLPPTVAAASLRMHLEAGAPGWEPETVQWAARLVRHAASGRPVMLRQFSATWGLSKEFEKHQARIERIIGPVGDLGIIDAASLLFIAGEGTLRFPEATIKIGASLGILGFERHVLKTLVRVEGERVFFVENKTVFEAIAKKTVPELENVLCVFTGGNVGSTIRHFASVTEGQIFVWADLDPEGVRIARHIYDASGKRAVPYRMTPEELLLGTDELDAERLRTLDQELAREGPLNELLHAIQATKRWREQEKQLPPAGGSDDTGSATSAQNGGAP